MKPALLLAVTIDATNNKLYVRITPAGSDTTVTLTNGTYFHVFDNDITSSLPAQIQSQLYGASQGIRVRIVEGRYVFTNAAGATFQLNTGANSVYAELGIKASQLGATAAVTLTAAYQHQNGWYGDNEGCLSNFIERGNIYETVSKQSISISGEVVTRYYNILQSRNISLRFLGKAKTYAYGATAYGDVTTLNRTTGVNESFELFYRKAIQGTRFRFYRDYNMIPIAKHTTSANTATTITVSDPSISGSSIYYGYTAEVVDSTVSAYNGESVIITSNTSTVITFSAGWVTALVANTPPIYIIDRRYNTYVMDRETVFSPIRVFADIDNLFDIQFNCWKYTA